MPERFSSKSGLTRTATRARHAERSRDVAPAASTSRVDSTLTSTPAATACASSASLLPGPAKLISRGVMPASSATVSSPAEATSRPSTRPAMCATSAGIGLAFIA